MTEDTNPRDFYKEWADMNGLVDTITEKRGAYNRGQEKDHKDGAFAELDTLVRDHFYGGDTDLQFESADILNRSEELKDQTAQDALYLMRDNASGFAAGVSENALEGIVNGGKHSVALGATDDKGKAVLGARKLYLGAKEFAERYAAGGKPETEDEQRLVSTAIIEGIAKSVEEDEAAQKYNMDTRGRILQRKLEDFKAGRINEDVAKKYAVDALNERTEEIKTELYDKAIENNDGKDWDVVTREAIEATINKGADERQLITDQLYRAEKGLPINPKE